MVYQRVILFLLVFGQLSPALHGVLSLHQNLKPVALVPVLEHVPQEHSIHISKQPNIPATISVLKGICKGQVLKTAQGFADIGVSSGRTNVGQSHISNIASKSIKLPHFELIPFKKNCYNPPMSATMNISDVAYDYPEHAVYEELYRKPDVLMSIYQSRRINQMKYRDRARYMSQYNSGCFALEANVEGFNWHGGYCWVLYPVHQGIKFVRCKYPKCGGYESRCSSKDYPQKVWVWCNYLPKGNRITRLTIPLPAQCYCGGLC